MIPLGVHVPGPIRGSYATELATSIAIGTLGMSLAVSMKDGVLLVAASVAQPVARIAIERHRKHPIALARGWRQG
jgi:hypothetical protein